MRYLTSLATLTACLFPIFAFAAGPINVLAAENFYGDVAEQIGGPAVKVSSVLSNPDQDPHLFEVSPSVARKVSGARIVVYSGLDYDSWMARLLRSSPQPGRITINVGQLAHRHVGDNPHIWYDTSVMLRYATVLSDELAKIDPVHAPEFGRRLARFRASMVPVQAKITALRARLGGTPVTATEPVFGYMLDALGMRSRDMGFQLAVMNNTEPSASQVAGFETDLRQHRVHMLVYNSQARDPIADRMMKLARAAHIPIVGATETEPHGVKYQAWMMNVLNAVEQALAK